MKSVIFTSVFDLFISSIYGRFVLCFWFQSHPQQVKQVFFGDLASVAHIRQSHELFHVLFLSLSIFTDFAKTVLDEFVDFFCF